MIKSGLKQDIDNLLEEFDKTRSLRFIDFACLWRDKSFNFIFTYKLNQNDLREFIEEAFNIVLDPLCSDTTPERSISSLYFIYCLYTSQPIEPKVPINLTLNKFKFFRSLLAATKESKQIDACYIFLKLVSLGAFNLVARNKPFGPLTIRKTVVSSAQTSRELPIGQLCDLESYIGKLQWIHTLYNNKKRSLEGDDVAEVKNLELINDELFSEYEKLSERTIPEAGSPDEVDVDGAQFNNL